MRMLSGAVLVLAAAVMLAGLAIADGICFASFKGNTYNWPFGMFVIAVVTAITGVCGLFLLISGAWASSETRGESPA